MLKGQLGFMRENGFRVLTVSAKGPEVDKIVDQENVAHHAIPFTRSITPIQDLICLKKLVQIFKKIKPDIVHTHTPKAGLLGMWAARIAGVPSRIHTIAGMPLIEYRGITRMLLEFSERWTYRNATKVFPNSQGLKKFVLEKKWVAENKVKVIGNGSSNGIDTYHFSVSNQVLETRNSELKTKINESNFIYCFIGRLVRDKGIKELVEAFKNIYEIDSNCKLLLVGPFEDHREPLNDDIKNTIKDHPGIMHVGYQEDVRPWLAMSDVFVFPSYREGFPNVVMQAGAMELPCIVTDIFGSNEIIEDGVNGLIIPVKDSNALEETMINLKADDSLRNRLKRNSREIIVEKYDQKRMWELILDEYNRHLKPQRQEESQSFAKIGSA